MASKMALDIPRWIKMASSRTLNSKAEYAPCLLGAPTGPTLHQYPFFPTILWRWVLVLKRQRIRQGAQGSAGRAGLGAAQQAALICGAWLGWARLRLGAALPRGSSDDVENSAMLRIRQGAQDSAGCAGFGRVRRVRQAPQRLLRRCAGCTGFGRVRRVRQGEQG